MAAAENVKSFGIGIALLVGAYVVYKTFSAGSKVAGSIAAAVTAPNAFTISSQNNLANKAFNAVTGGPGSGDAQEWTWGTKFYDWTHPTPTSAPLLYPAPTTRADGAIQ